MSIARVITLKLSCIILISVQNSTLKNLTFAKSQHVSLDFSSGSATPGSRVQARVMTLWVGVTFILAFAIVATLEVNINKSKQLGSF